VSAQGLGCMGMTAFYGTFDREATEEESLRVFGTALECGINFVDTAWIYQSFGCDGKVNTTNEELVGKALKMYGREKFIVATKFGICIEDGKEQFSGKEALIRSQLADSLARLDVDYIDLYYMHRMDPSTPIEDTMRVLKALVEEGKIRYVGLSECSASELRRAHAVHPVTAIQMEWSLQTRDLETDVVPCARELGVGIVAYSPLARGFLASATAAESWDAKDWRLKSNPRFCDPENVQKNKDACSSFFALAAARHCTPAQLCLAWVHAQGEDVFPIPGTKSSSRLVENAAAFALLPLTREEVSEIEASVKGVYGERYSEAGMQRAFTARP
jgi:aryl-alcohol dehydrogenase-like predicted oxidoreductase